MGIAFPTPTPDSRNARPKQLKTMGEIRQENWTKETLKAEIKRLQLILERMEETDMLNMPHKQLDLFEKEE